MMNKSKLIAVSIIGAATATALVAALTVNIFERKQEAKQNNNAQENSVTTTLDFEIPTEKSESHTAPRASAAPNMATCKTHSL